MAQTITVKCPQCDRIYIDWHVPAIQPQFSENQISDTYKPTTTCSKCGTRSVLSDLTEKKGVYQQVASA
ncbi:MAG: hypothetical protein AAFQ63_02025 [Cyanobacteria bacterium J06621_11]